MILQKQEVLSFFSILILAFSTSLFAQNDVMWAGAWQYGPADAVYVDSDNQVAFLGAGGAVMIVDISDPANPDMVSDDLRTMGFVRDIWYQNNKLYLACGRGGMEIWNVADYSNPFLMSRTDIIYGGVPAPVEEIELYNDIAVVMCDWGYVHTVDVSNPYSPEQLNFNGQMGNPAHHIYIDEDGVIHATGAQFYLQLSIGVGGTLNTGGGKEFIYGAGNLYGRENEAFVYYSGYMYILDLTLPGFPAWSITEVTFSDIDVKDNTAYLVNNDGFEIWDVSDVQNPYMMSNVPFDYGNELFIGEEYAYVSADHKGIQIIDITDPSNPLSVGQLGAYSWTPSFDQTGTTGFVANGIGLYSVDLSNPFGAGPEMLDHILTEGQLNDVACEGTNVYLADWTGGFRTIDASDPENLMQLSSVPVQAWKIAAQGDYVYIAEANPNFPDTLKIFDVSNPSSPVMTASYTFSEDDVREMEVADGYLYIANFNSGLRIFDITNANDPVEISSVDLPWVLDVDLAGDVAYVASGDWEGGLVSVDISDPLNPVILQIYNPSGWFHPFHVGVDETYAYASDIYGEMYVFDVTDPSNMLELETVTLPGDILNIVAMNDGFVYVSDGQAGLQIFVNTLVTSIREEEENQDWTSGEAKVYPNPSGGQITVDFNLPANGLTEVGIFDVTGKKIASVSRSHLTKGHHHITWSGKNFSGVPVPKGIYFIRITHPDIVVNNKIIIDR